VAEFLYSVEREYPVSIHDLWQAWSQSSALQEWYCPTQLSVVPGSALSQTQVDGWWTVGVDASAYGHIAYFYGKYSEVVEHEKLVHSLYYTTDEVEFAARDLSVEHHQIVIDFEDRGDSSWVRFAQFGELPEGQAAQAQAGMESYFDNLSSYLDKHA
jgi:uncharacterized protein YndB with AHSA1/START domain